MEENNIEDLIIIPRRKIIFVGDYGVGKTSIIKRIINNEFSENHEATLGVDFLSKDIKYKDKSIKLQIWDTAGQEKYMSLISSYVKNCSIAFLVYDISNKKSFDNIPKWIKFIKSIENTKIVIVGNKIDINERQITKEMGEELAYKEGLFFFEVSAKLNFNIIDMFYSPIAELSFFNMILDKNILIKALIRENENRVLNKKKNIIQNAQIIRNIDNNKEKKSVQEKKSVNILI